MIAYHAATISSGFGIPEELEKPCPLVYSKRVIYKFVER